MSDAGDGQKAEGKGVSTRNTPAEFPKIVVVGDKNCRHFPAIRRVRILAMSPPLCQIIPLATHTTLFWTRRWGGGHGGGNGAGTAARTTPSVIPGGDICGSP